MAGRSTWTTCESSSASTTTGGSPSTWNISRSTIRPTRPSTPSSSASLARPALPEATSSPKRPAIPRTSATSPRITTTSADRTSTTPISPRAFRWSPRRRCSRWRAPSTAKRSCPGCVWPEGWRSTASRTGGSCARRRSRSSTCSPRPPATQSILADPRRADMKDIVNTKIKFREPYRPFAPSVLVERAHEFYDLKDAERHYPARFMLLVVDVDDAKREVVPAPTHVDGTARLQTVFRDTNPRYHRLIETFGKATGVPVLLNTSFNLKGEPIVNTPAEAFSTFARSGMDMLVHPASRERAERLGRSIDDRLTLQVEGGVQEDRHPGGLPERLDQSVIARVGVPEHRLQPRRPVHVRRGGHHLALGVVDIHDEQHEPRGIVPLRILQVVELVGALHEDRRCEGPIRLPELDLGVDDVLHVGAAGVRKDALGCGRPRAARRAPRTASRAGSARSRRC